MSDLRPTPEPGTVLDGSQNPDRPRVQRKRVMAAVISAREVPHAT
jgi:hypothetical protein